MKLFIQYSYTTAPQIPFSSNVWTFPRSIPSHSSLLQKFTRQFWNPSFVPLMWVYLPENTGTSTEESSEEEEEDEAEEEEEEEEEDSGESLARILSLFHTVSLGCVWSPDSHRSPFVFQQKAVLRRTSQREVWNNNDLQSIRSSLQSVPGN